MSSKPTTPLTQRRPYPGEIEGTRIPIPSPQPFRRSISLRLRGDNKNNCGEFFSPTSPPKFYHHHNHHHQQQQQRQGIEEKQNCISSEAGGGGVGGGVGGGGGCCCHCSGTTSFGDGRKELHHNNSRSLSYIMESDHGCAKKGFQPHHHHQQQQQQQQNHIGASNHIGVKTSPTAATSVAASAKREHHGMSLNLTNSGTSSSTIKSPRTPQTPNTPSSSGSSHHSHGYAQQQSHQQQQQQHYSNTNRLTPKTPPVTPDDSMLNGYLEDDDLDSLRSYSSAASGRSAMSCEHAYVARNGTTFSGRKMKYVVHCSSYAGQTGQDYLTPTQRAQKHIRRLKELLFQAKLDLEQKDSEILRLTKEVVELRLFKASLSSPEEPRSNSSDAVTVRENTEQIDLKTSTDVSPIVDMTDDALKSSPRHQLHHHLNQQSQHHQHQHHGGLHQVQLIEKLTNSEMQSSFADSGHFEDMTTSSIHSKDSFVQTHDQACGNDHFEVERQALIDMYEKRIEELIRQKDTEQHEDKRSHNDRVEALLQKLAECNTRYADIVPDYEQAKERIRELEKQLEALQLKLQEQEDKHNKMYLHMYAKGQEAERLQHADQVLEFAQHAPNRVSVPELLQQLQVTQDELENIKDTSYQPESGNSQTLLSAKEAISLWLLGARKTMYRRLIEAQQTRHKVDPEVTLQFLKSAIYYFLTDKENSEGHLNAIESILGFSELEKLYIDKARWIK